MIGHKQATHNVANIITIGGEETSGKLCKRSPPSSLFKRRSFGFEFFHLGSWAGRTWLNRTIRALVAAPGEALGTLDRSNVNLMNIQEDGGAHHIQYRALMNIQQPQGNCGGMYCGLATSLL